METAIAWIVTKLLGPGNTFKARVLRWLLKYGAGWLLKKYSEWKKKREINKKVEQESADRKKTDQQNIQDLNQAVNSGASPEEVAQHGEDLFNGVNR